MSDAEFVALLSIGASAIQISNRSLPFPEISARYIGERNGSGTPLQHPLRRNLLPGGFSMFLILQPRTFQGPGRQGL
jgi:hypothetical protein